jgi:hypothetical protein
MKRSAFYDVFGKEEDECTSVELLLPGKLMIFKKAVFWDVTLCGSCKNRRFGETLVLTRSTRRNIPDVGILHSHRRETSNLAMTFLPLIKWNKVSSPGGKRDRRVKLTSTYCQGQRAEKIRGFHGVKIYQNTRTNASEDYGQTDK